MILALPEGAIPLLVGTGLAVGALTIVLSPLLSSIDTPPTPPRAVRDDAGEDRPLTAVDALREIEFDRVTGKLSDADYSALKTRYTRDALAELRATAPAAGAAEATAGANAGIDRVEDRVEAAIRRAKAQVRECTACGPRPETDATYCSSCGRYLPGRCRGCGQSIDQLGARFCTGCGEQLSAA